MLAVKSDLPCQLLSSPSDLEILCVQLKSLLIICCVIYIPPNSSAAYCECLFNFLLNICNGSNKLVILGDFNFPDINWDTLSGDSPVSNRLCDVTCFIR